MSKVREREGVNKLVGESGGGGWGERVGERGG